MVTGSVTVQPPRNVSPFQPFQRPSGSRTFFSVAPFSSTGAANRRSPSMNWVLTLSKPCPGKA